MHVCLAFSNNKDLASSTIWTLEAWLINKLKPLLNRHRKPFVHPSKKKQVSWVRSVTPLYLLISNRVTLNNHQEWLNNSSNLRLSQKNKSRSLDKRLVHSDRPLVAWPPSGLKTSSQDPSWPVLSQRHKFLQCPKSHHKNNKRRNHRLTHWTQPWLQPSGSATVVPDPSRTSHIASCVTVSSIDCMLVATTATTAQGVVVAITLRRT